MYRFYQINVGIYSEGEGVAAKVLSNLGIELNKVRSAVEFIYGRGDGSVLGEIELAPRFKKAIELAVDEARRLNHHYIGTEHLLLGLIRESEGTADAVLESLEVNLEEVRRGVIQALIEEAQQEGLPPAIGLYLDDLLTSAGIVSVDADTREAMIHELQVRLDKHLMIKILHHSSVEKWKELTKVLEEGPSPEEIRRFIEATVPNVQDIFLVVYEEFRDLYLHGLKHD